MATKTQEKQLPATVVESGRATLTSVPVMTADDVQQRLEVFRGFVAQNLKKGEHYGIIPGTEKKTLLKPGAEIICEFYGWYPSIKFLTYIENWDRDPALFDYTIELTLHSKIDDRIIGVGVGSCNSYEGRYRWRNADRICPSCEKVGTIKRSKFPDKNTGDAGWYCYGKIGGCDAKFHSEDETIINQQLGKVPNDDIATLKNTVLKMAKKRALVDAAISCSRSSAIFTQDVEDFEGSNVDLVADVTVMATERSLQREDFGAPDENGEVKQKNESQSKSQASGKTAPATGTTGKTQQSTEGGQKSQETAPSESQGAKPAPKETATTSTTATPSELPTEAKDVLTWINSGVMGDEGEFDLAKAKPRMRQFFIAIFGGDLGPSYLNYYLNKVRGVTPDNAASTVTWKLCKEAITWARDPKEIEKMLEAVAQAKSAS